MHAEKPRPLSAHTSAALKGVVKVPGDKSISHRALIFGALATGTTRISGLLTAEDVLNTAQSVSALGASVTKDGDVWLVRGRGPGGLSAPVKPLEFGNSGTGTRLMMGVVAGHSMTVQMTGDASLSRRPMGRVLQPLQTMGLQVEDDRTQLPLTLRGTADLIPITYQLPVPSAQVKSAILLAGLNTAGQTSVIETEATRDHTERMMRYFGAKLSVEKDADGRTVISVSGGGELHGRDVLVPGDPSSAAFLVAAALIVPGSDITIENVLINPTRIGFYQTVREMGGDITFLNEREEAGEPIADIRVRHSKLSGTHVPPERAPSMIDEYPVLAAIAGFARGEMRMEGLAELRVKESDRLAATLAGLHANGVEARVEGDCLIVAGAGQVSGGGVVKTDMDHRIAMSFLVAGLASDKPVTVDDTTMIATSFPEFQGLMAKLGATFEQEQPA